jgi:excisionase family DNA binding protein
MSASAALSAANDALVIIDATHTWSPARPEETTYAMPLQQSLDLDAPRVDTSLVNASRTPTRKTRVNGSPGVAEKRQKTLCAEEDDTTVTKSSQCDSGKEGVERLAVLASVTSVRNIPESPLPSSANAVGSGAVFPSCAPRRADVPLADRVALSVEEAGALLGISRDLAYDLVGRGELPSVRLGRRLVVPRRALEGALDRLSESGH